MIAPKTFKTRIKGIRTVLLRHHFPFADKIMAKEPLAEHKKNVCFPDLSTCTFHDTIAFCGFVSPTSTRCSNAMLIFPRSRLW